MLEWLKTVLGDAYTPEIDTAVSQEIGKGFVARTDFNTKTAKVTELETEVKQLREGIKTRDTQLGELKKSAGDNKAGRILGKAGQALIVHEPDALRQWCLFLSEHVKTSYADLTQKLRWWMYSSSGAPSMLSASLRTIYCIQVLRPCNLTFPKYALGLLTERAPLAMRLMVNATLLCP